MVSDISALRGPECRLLKIYCYRGKSKQIWYECEDVQTGLGVAWSPSRGTVIRKAQKTGYTVINPDEAVPKFYRSK